MNYSLLIIFLPYSSQLSCSLFNWSLKAINLVFSISSWICALSSLPTSTAKSLTIISPSLSIINLNSNLPTSSGGLALISPVIGSNSTQSGIADPSFKTNLVFSKLPNKVSGTLISNVSPLLIV